MPEVRATITTDYKPQLTQLVRRLPAILAGRVPDEAGIAAGFKARIGYTILSLILPNFNEMGRGMPGADGTKWNPLTRSYVAYHRRFGPGEKVALKEAAGLGKGHNKAPGKKKGLLTVEQLKLWRRTYADRLAWYIMRQPDADARAHAAAVAWIVVKKAGAKTMLEVFGGRMVQILVDTGYLRGSLTPGTLLEGGPHAAYQPPSEAGAQDQIFETQQAGLLVVGSQVRYAAAHHAAKDPKRRRRLWPERFPDTWWQQILGSAVSGLSRIHELFKPGGM